MPSANPKNHQHTSDGAFRIYDTDELFLFPPPSWLIDGVLPNAGVAGIYGPPKSGKTFVALDMALSVASGHDWQDIAVEHSEVLYVSAEGTAGLSKRVRAWLWMNGLTSHDLSIGWITEPLPVYANSEGIKDVFARFEELDRHPALIVLDTLARCFEGDENKTQDMSLFINGVDQLRRESNATILVVHHTNADASRERGNTAFRGAVDTMLCVTPGRPHEVENQRALRQIIKPTEGLFMLECAAQKDAPTFFPGMGRLVVVPEVDSCGIDMVWKSSHDIDLP